MMASLWGDRGKVAKLRDAWEQIRVCPVNRKTPLQLARIQDSCVQKSLN
jgi:hypothetical protein